MSDINRPSPPAKLILTQSSTIREKSNVEIHDLYLRGDLAKCLEVCNSQLDATNNTSEYALYVKALLKRYDGDILNSLSLFQSAAVLNPHNVDNLKQVGRSLFLLGKIFLLLFYFYLYC